MLPKNKKYKLNNIIFIKVYLFNENQAMTQRFAYD